MGMELQVSTTHSDTYNSMTFKETLFGAGILMLLASCSSTNDVVSNGPFQKRKYQKGWHVNLNTGKRSGETQARKVNERTWMAQEISVSAMAEVPVVEMPVVETAERTEPVQSLERRAVSQVQEEVTASVGERVLEKPQTALERLSAQEEVFTPSPTGPEGETDRMNGMAIAGFICSLFLPLLGLIFSAIALGQIKRKGGRGKGLATAGLVISIVTMLLLIALL